MSVQTGDITLMIMNRTGHSTEKVGFEDATRIVREEMGKGKWLRIVDEDGRSYIQSSIDMAVSTMESLKDKLASARSIMLIGAVAGGAPAGMVEINGKFFPVDKVCIKVDGHEVKLDMSSGPAPSAGCCGTAPKSCCAPKAEPKLSINCRIVTDEDSDIIIGVGRDENGDMVVEFNNAYGLDEAKEAMIATLAVIEAKYAEICNGIPGASIVDEEDLD